MIQNPFAGNGKVKDGVSFKIQIFLFPMLTFFYIFHSRRPFLIYLPFCCVGVAKLVGFSAVHNALCLK